MSRPQRGGSASGAGGQGYPQDYIVRIRYQNNLPPPPCPPKLLDIPNNAAAQYTDPTFTSRLARMELLNMELDSELGLPLDLVPVPRIFDGDDSAIQPIIPTPPIDPRDRPLLRPASALGKASSRNAGAGSNVSFLRRTEYISSEQARSTFKSTTSDRLISNRAKRTLKPEDNDPVRILYAVMKGFDVANPETAGKDSAAGQLTDQASANAERNWKELRHPNKPHVRAVETYPLLPDFEATNDSGGYMVFKFSSNPMAPTKRRDTRVDVGLLKPREKPVDEDGNVDASAGQDIFDYYIPDTEAVGNSIKRKFAAYAADPSDDEEPVEDDDEFIYNYVRGYETKSHTQHNPDTVEEAALLLHGGDSKKPKGAYFYPILTRYVIRPKRKNKNPPGMLINRKEEDYEDEADKAPEIMNVKVRSLNGEERRRRGEMKSNWMSKVAVHEE
ncbi:hypothetical protein RUND412_006345 [Rhizina undulata]